MNDKNSFFLRCHTYFNVTFFMPLYCETSWVLTMINIFLVKPVVNLVLFVNL